MLLSIAIIVLLSAMSAPVLESLIHRNDVAVAQQAAVNGMRRAEQLARSSASNQSWGVYVQAGRITVFQGASYASRDTAFDEEFIFASSIAVTGMQEVVFSKFSGTPSTTGTLTFTARDNGVKTVTVNAVGMIGYE